jgi:Family of unknown function (DUF5309)
MATYQTFQQVGIKENISDIIVNLTPTKVPFQSNIGTEKIHNVLFQWQEDSLRTAVANAQVEGADPSFITATPTVLRNNVTQILTEAVVVSDTADTVTVYGRAKEMAYQLQKSASQVKRDLEFALVGSAQTLVTGNTSTARQMASAQLQVSAGNITYAGAATNISEAILLTNLQACFVAGAEPSRIMVTPSNSVLVAGFASAAGRYRTIPGEKAGDTSGIVNVVNFYVSPFGEQKVEINRFIKAKNTLVYDPKQWSKAILRPWTREALAKTGDASKQMIVTEQSLKHKNYLASGFIIDNATSGF